MPDVNNPAIIGKDVTVYNLTATGTLSLLGRWESVEILTKYNWANATPSDAVTPYKKQMTYEFTGTLVNFMDSGGSILLESALQASEIYFSFTDQVSGMTLTVYAGISSAGFTANQEAWKDKLDFESIGLYQGTTAPITYST